MPTPFQTIAPGLNQRERSLTRLCLLSTALRTLGSHTLDGGTKRSAQTLRHSVRRFYFHLYNDIDVPDDEGVELADLEAARAHAVRCARVTFAQTAKDEGRVVLHHRIDIEDERGAVLDTVHFRDAVKVED
jgi:hypothetical protein